MMVYRKDLDANYNTILRTFEAEMGKRIISNQLTVKSLSGTKTYKGQDLDGYFQIDSEGVAPAKELVLIENGVLKNMLNGRIPTEKNTHSNGHNRFMLNDHFDRPSTSIYPGVIQFTGKNPVSYTSLKSKLIEAARKAGLEYAYIIKSNYEGTRIYVEDGREELVRGFYDSFYSYKVFQEILGISNDEYISTHWSRGSVSSYIFPKSILFKELEISK